MTKSALLELCVAHSASTTTPSVTLNTPANSGSSSSLTPQLQWTGVAGNSQLIPYEVQLDTVNTFNSIPSTPSVVGSRGTVTTVSASSVSPPFGQATTAGNLLIAWVTSNDSSGSITTASPGWAALTPQPSTAFLATAIFGKFNCAAGEAAPTFSSAAGNSMVAQAGEYSIGPGAAVDQSGGHSIAQTGSASATAVDTHAGDLVIALEFWGGSNAGPTTIGCVLTDSNGSTITSPNIVDNHTTTGTSFYAFADAVTVRTGVVGGDKIAASLGVFANGSACIVSIKPGATPLVDALSAAGTGFADITHPGDTSPYPSGDQVGYTLQSALTNSTVYYWRVRQLPATANVNYTSAWSSTFSFTAASGGSSVSISDSASPTDTIARVQADARALSDTATPTNTITRAQADSRAVSDTATPSDTLGRAQADTRAFSDTATPSDTLTRVQANTRALSDTATPTNTIARAQVDARALSDTATPSDTLARVQADARALSDTASPADSLSHGSIFANRAVSDTATPTDGIARGALTMARGPFETAAPTDACTRTSSHSRACSDAASPSDGLGRGVAHSRSIFEVATPTDLCARAIAQARACLDTAVSADEISVHLVPVGVAMRFDFTEVVVSLGWVDPAMSLAYAAAPSLAFAATAPSLSFTADTPTLGFHVEPLTFEEP